MTISSLLFQKYSNITYWKIELSVIYYFNGTKFKGIDEIILKVNELPVNGTCQVYNHTGIAFETNFLISCVDWVDPDGIIYSYDFYGNF